MGQNQIDDAGIWLSSISKEMFHKDYLVTSKIFYALFLRKYYLQREGEGAVAP